jgi:hypothetical protein
MTEPFPAEPESPSSVRAQLVELAGHLKDVAHLEPAAQRALADLVVELAGALDPAATSEQRAHLADASAQLVRALHEQHNEGLVAAAKHRLEEAAARAEATAPVATGVARRLIELLSELGI